MYTSAHAGRTRTLRCTVTAASTSDLTLGMFQQLCWSDTKWFCTVATPLTSRVLELHAVHTAQVTVCSYVLLLLLLFMYLYIYYICIYHNTIN